MNDTLDILITAKDTTPEEVHLPQYYRETFFAGNKLLHPELTGGRYGVAGDPMPYAVRNDDVITGLLLGCFILALLSFPRMGGILMKQFKNIFNPSRTADSGMSETTGELHFQSFLILQTCLLFSLLTFFYCQERVADTYILSSPYQLLGIFFAIILGMFLLKIVLYAAVNSVFFEQKKNGQWMHLQLFVFSAEGIVFFPLVLVQVYFGLTIQTTVILSAIVLILVKILLFYKCFDIFFKGTGVYLQIILYFCALEIIPLLSLGAILVMTANELKINF